MINFLLPTKTATVQTLGHPAAGVIGWFDTSANATGIPVNKDSALTFAAVWCAVRVISETLGTLPCVLYKRTDGGRERATDDARYALMHDAPHPQMSAVSFFESQTAQMVLTGNCYSRIRASRSQQQMQLEPRQPENVEVITDGDRLRYKVTGDIQEDLQAPQMLHVPGFGGDGITGLSVIKYAQQSIGTGMAGEQYAASMLGSGATPHGIIEHPGRLDKEAREQLRKEWDQLHGGSEKAGRIGIMHGGMKFQPVSMSAEDAQFLQSREYSVREIARWFRLPPHMLGDLADSSVRANIEQQAIEFVVYSMAPWLRRWESTLNRKLLLPDERQELYFEFLVDSLLRGDIKSRYEAYAIGRQWGWLSENDVRDRENLNSIPGGDEYMRPMNMEIIGQEPREVAAFGANDLHEAEARLQQAMQAGFAQSVIAIGMECRALRLELERGRDLNAAMADANERVSDRITGVRSEIADLRKAIAGPSHEIAESAAEIIKQQNATACAIKNGLEDTQEIVSAGMAAAADIHRDTAIAINDLLAEHLERSHNVEKTKVIAAAKQAERKNKNFIGWLDEFYQTFEAQLADRIASVAACYARLHDCKATDLHERLAHRVCEQHKVDLLAAADGGREEFVLRVEAITDKWAARVRHIRLGDEL